MGNIGIGMVLFIYDRLLVQLQGWLFWNGIMAVECNDMQKRRCNENAIGIRMSNVRFRPVTSF